VKVEALRWKGDALELLDQRQLPDRVVYVSCRNAADVAAAIRDMVVRGAPAIGCAAAFGIALEPTESSYEVLAKSRPTAVNLFWALERMRRAKDKRAEAEAIFAEDLAVNRSIGAHGAKLIPQDACETRPYLQGARLTAWECMQEGIPCTLITDNMAGHLMQRGQVDLIVVGADRVAANGDVANKIGTYTLAVLAARHGLPFYVAAPLSTIDRKVPDGMAIPIEERAAAEVTGFRGERWAPEGVAVVNPAFDVTPAELVTALITERGIVSPVTADGVRRLFEEVLEVR